MARAGSLERVRSALFTGLRRALYIHLVLPLYLCALLLGLVQTWPLLVAAGRGALRSLLLDELATGSSDALLDLFLHSPAMVAGAAIWGLALLPLTALFGLLYNFFGGGILRAYAARPATGEAWRTFWSGCRRFFWTFTGLSALLVLLALLLTLAIALLGRPLGASGTLIAIVVLLQCANVVGEYARAIAVARDQRNPLRLLLMALRFCGRNLPGVLLLTALGLLLHAGLAALYMVVARPLDGSPGTILWQQAVLLASIWIKFLRLAWALSYVQETDAPRNEPAAPEVPVPAASVS